jgi:excisionase family DNA binding protein
MLTLVSSKSQDQEECHKFVLASKNITGLICCNWMPRRRHRNGLYKSSQVAKILGVSSRTLYRMLKDGRIQEPMRNPDNHYRLWTEVNIQEIREALSK